MENRRKSKAKRARKSGFLVRQNTRKGRKINASKRRTGRNVNITKKV
ncbi:MAG: 50S ribosomal protein L34 [Planctomycetales bacterium]|nr:50S ribosomal protein L34 [Planctomycetales bacterium]